MGTRLHGPTAREFDDASRAGSKARYVLRLCVSGMSPKSQQAIVNVRRICDEHLRGRYTLEVIDIYQQPELAARHQIVATPTLIREWPSPIRHLLGSLSDIPRALARLGVAAAVS